jgi:hypothetical protein
MAKENLDMAYKGYRIYYGGPIYGICVNNPQGIRVVIDTNVRTAKILIKAFIKEGK